MEKYWSAEASILKFLVKFWNTENFANVFRKLKRNFANVMHSLKRGDLKSAKLILRESEKTEFK